MVQEANKVHNWKITDFLNTSLKSTKIYSSFLIPAVFNCILYVIHFSADLVVAIQHFREGHSIWGWTTICLMYFPALVYLILIVSRPDWWMANDNVFKKKGFIIWFILEIIKFAAFPLFSLYR